MTGPVYESDDASVLAAGRKVTEFADQVFTRLPRADQRRWAAAYLLGLLAVSGRKSVRSLAAAVTETLRDTAASRWRETGSPPPRRARPEVEEILIEEEEAR